jgi:hypothetical protein
LAVPTSCGPSPCGRLSRPRTTMAAPTLPLFLSPAAGDICFEGSLPRSRQWTLHSDLGCGYLCDPSPSSGNPD